MAVQAMVHPWDTLNITLSAEKGRLKEAGISMLESAEIP